LADLTVTYNDEIFGSFYDRGAVVFRQGDPGDTMYIIQSGAAEVCQLQDGREVVLALLEKGDFFGEMALIDERPRSATVTVIQPTRLLPLTKTSMLKRIRQDPGVAFHLIKALSHRIEQATNRLRNMVEDDESLQSVLESREKETLIDEQDPFSQKEFLSVEQDIPQSEDQLVQVDDLSLKHKESISFEANRTIFSQGDPAKILYVIAEGSVEISQDTLKGKCVLARLGPGDIFGEIALLTDLPRTATASTIEPTRLLAVSQDEFFSRMKVEPELALYILQVLIMRLRRIHQAMDDPKKSIDTVKLLPPPMVKHNGLVKVAVVSLSTCGGCAATLLENQEELANFLQRVQITYCPMLIDHHEIKDAVDLAIVDGVVRVQEDEKKLKEARQKSRHLIAWGTCAVLGGIPSLANQFELEEVIDASYGQTQDPLDYYLSESRGTRCATYENENLTLLRRAGRVSDFVRVDYYLPGCPPQTKLLSRLINELGGEPQSIKTPQIVCVECDRRPRKTETETFWVFPKFDWDAAQCFSSGAAPCFGFLTRGGCGAVCPSNGLPCWGCRGPSASALKKVNHGDTFEQIVHNSLVKRCSVPVGEIGTVMRIIRSRGSSLLNFYHDSTFELSKLR
jgi:F420-non-reducing hydrogenase small subunit